MPRKKVDTPPRLQSWKDVDSALKSILECESCIDEINVELTRQIAAAKETADRNARNAVEQLRQWESDVKDFVVRHRDDISGKTMKLNFGSTGFRMSTSLVVPPSKTADVIENLRRCGMEDCISVRESVDKEALKRYPGDTILKTGAYLKTVDEFWYEVNHEALVTKAD